VPQGKPFICWLDYDGRRNAVPLCVGDEVEYKLNGKWLRGKIGCKRKGGWYVFRHKKQEYLVASRISLRSVAV